MKTKTKQHSFILRLYMYCCLRVLQGELSNADSDPSFCVTTLLWLIIRRTVIGITDLLTDWLREDTFIYRQSIFFFFDSLEIAIVLHIFLPQSSRVIFTFCFMLWFCNIWIKLKREKNRKLQILTDISIKVWIKRR